MRTLIGIGAIALALWLLLGRRGKTLTRADIIAAVKNFGRHTEEQLQALSDIQLQALLADLTSDTSTQRPTEQGGGLIRTPKCNCQTWDPMASGGPKYVFGVMEGNRCVKQECR